MTFIEINAWPVRDKVGMGVSIQILEKSLCKGRNGRDYLQFNTVHQLQEVTQTFTLKCPRLMLEDTH